MIHSIICLRPRSNKIARPVASHSSSSRQPTMARLVGLAPITVPVVVLKPAMAISAPASIWTSSKVMTSAAQKRPRSGLTTVTSIASNHNIRTTTRWLDKNQDNKRSLKPTAWVIMASHLAVSAVEAVTEDTVWPVHMTIWAIPKISSLSMAARRVFGTMRRLRSCGSQHSSCAVWQIHLWKQAYIGRYPSICLSYLVLSKHI